MRYDVTWRTSPEDPSLQEVKVSHPRGLGYADVLLGSRADIASYLSDRFHDDFGVLDRGDRLDPVAYLDWIQVNDEKRGRGVGTRLLEATLALLDDTNVSFTYGLSAAGEDQDPQRLLFWYLDHGFERVTDDPLADDVFIERPRGR